MLKDSEMSNSRILYVCQEVAPYLPDNDMSHLCRTLSQSMQERGNEIRTFMPRYGLINERRNQLHEVIRLSGMNLIIDDNDHQLIIKVASIPSARVQVYFIDNDDYFQRKAVLTDSGGTYFEDNDERALFFARGVIETVKKLRWSPDIIHIHGWFASLLPVYLKTVFSDDPLFAESKIIISLYDDNFPGQLNASFRSKLEKEGIKSDELSLLDEPTYENLVKFVISHIDGVIFETPDIPAEIKRYISERKLPFLNYIDKTTSNYLDEYQKFYETILSGK